MATWQPTRRSDAADVALTAVLGATAAVSLHIGGDPLIVPAEMADYHRPLGIAVVTLIVAPLAVRRRFPLTVLAVVTAAYVPLSLGRVPELSVAPIAYFIAFYTAGAYGGRRRELVRLAAVIVIFALVVEGIAASSDSYEGNVNPWLINILTAVQNLFYLAAAWLLGDLARTGREREAKLVAQADALRAAQAERARRAVVDERVRIARELHDVVAHHVSVMGVQAGAARRVLDARPEAVPELLGSIETASRQAVGELQRTLGLLRADPGASGSGARDGRRIGDAYPGGDGDRDGQPSLAQLDALVGQMRDAGLDVDASVEGSTAGLPAAVDLSAYRIVQEALTNTLKHAGAGTAARVQVARRARALEITVADDGRAGGGDPAGTGPDGDDDGGPGAEAGAGTVTDGTDSSGGTSGHGLLGMRERVALLGGELKYGRARGGGFEVRAWLPLPAGGEA
ncbi:MAG TPA: sensor histidine kinase [Acidimicrobiales bacterium]